ncbi:hypothetical protein KP509_21G052800 [Ceratopteris richardii]|uniref:Endonuclease/exonuclease/phosphatase domain-containing protein n=1 Tax=Ceratopteris richardii TaxID=49495 RepID=A0A8T2SBF1_CERRI|nr:hypothetical protein KP509_21G052800 [Ceratopteris richardii]
MKFTSLNVRGLSDPSRAAILGQWFKDKCLNPDFICLQEIKIDGEDLQKRLKCVSPTHLWFSTSHPRGAGGAAIGISHSLSGSVISTFEDRNHPWIAASIGFPFQFIVASIYAPNGEADRIDTWASLDSLSHNVLICGDFNMVEFLEDRWNKKGKIIDGQEKEIWDKIKLHLDLVEVKDMKGFSWSNLQLGDSLRKARLDRCYIDQDTILQWGIPLISQHMDLTISYHYPITLSFTDFHAPKSPLVSCLLDIVFPPLSPPRNLCNVGGSLCLL